MRKKTAPIFITIVLIIIIAAAVFGKKIYDRYSYSRERADLTAYFGIRDAADIPIILQNEQIEAHARLFEGAAYMTLADVHRYLNERFYEGAEDGLLIYTTPTQIITAQIGTNQWQEGDGELQTQDGPVAVYEDGTLYVALNYVKRYTNFSYEIFLDPNHMQMYTEWPAQERAEITKDTKLRVRGGVKSEILCDLEQGDQVTVLEEMDDWSKVKTEDAYIGYVENKRLGLWQTVAGIPVTDYEEPVYTSQTRPWRISLGWHVVAGTAGNATLSAATANTKGLNVISPTWFYLTGDAGEVHSFASADYVKQAHAMGLEVWGLVDNFTEQDVDTYEVLSHAASRARLIDGLIGYARTYELDGLNIDFEGIREECGPSFVEFIRELSIPCREHELVLSVDNYVPTEGNAFYNRREQGTVADYVIIMGYDEHYRGSAPGSVASIGFVREGIEDTLKEVPAEKVVNAVPFYTRIWETRQGEVSSQAVGMAQANEYIARNGIDMRWDEETAQQYGEKTGSDGTLVQIWLEDAESIGAKLSVMEVCGIAGVAAWRLGFETSDVWTELAAYTGDS